MHGNYKATAHLGREILKSTKPMRVVTTIICLLFWLALRKCNGWEWHDHSRLEIFIFYVFNARFVYRANREHYWSRMKPSSGVQFTHATKHCIVFHKSTINFLISAIIMLHGYFCCCWYNLAVSTPWVCEYGKVLCPGLCSGVLLWKRLTRERR